MGRKKKRKEKIEKIAIWCFYCDKEYSDEKSLIQHQKLKHFKVSEVDDCFLMIHLCCF